MYSCSGDDIEKDLNWICDEYDEIEDSAMGHNVLIYDIPEGQETFDIRYDKLFYSSAEYTKYGLVAIHLTKK